MRSDRIPQKPLAASAQNLSRILVASYFIAVALNLIDGTMGHALAQWVVPADYVALTASAVIFTLAFLVMIAVWLRPAALLLAIVVFWSGFMALLGPDAARSLDAFWRDLALIGALFLTYAQSGRAARNRSILRRRHTVRKLQAGATAPRRVTSTVNSASPDRPAPEVASRVPRPVPMPDLQPVPVPEFRSRSRANLSLVETSDHTDNIFNDDPPRKARA